MKTKNKILALVEIVVVLCSVFLVALPAIAAEQNQEMQKVSASGVITASEDDYVLGVYGNANEDDTIDMRDLTYVKLIFFGKKPETELADAKYDDKINPLDFIQIKLIIVGKEKELTIVDSADRIVTVKKPLERIITTSSDEVETMRSLKLEKDRIVGVPSSVKHKFTIFFPEFSDHPCIGTNPFDFEKVLSLHPNAVFKYASFGEETTQKLEDMGITVLCFDFYRPGDIYVEETKKLGYILDKKEESKDFLNFYEGCLNTVKEGYEDIPMDERPRVYLEYKKYHTAGKGAGYHQKVEIAGGNNIFGDLSSGYFSVDAEEVIERNPEIIIQLGSYKQTGYGVDDFTGAKDTRNEILSRPELAEVTAVKNSRVYIISNAVYSGANHFIGTGYLAKWFYPHLFEDLDPKAIHQKYLTEFQGLDYDLDEHGVFVYPEPS